MEEVIEALRESAESVPVPLELPTFEQLVEAQEAMLVSLPDDYREFLFTVSDLVVGHLEPATIADSSSHTYLPELASRAWDVGLDRHLIPVCEFADGYYYVAPDGEVGCWPEAANGSWPSIWHWAREVWLP